MSPAPGTLDPWIPGAYARMRRNLRDILTIGVTGTKGKTSTTEFVAQLLEAHGLLTALSTTESARIGTRYYEGFWSVPELHRFVGLAKRASVDCLVIELCSSALRWDLHTAFSLDVAILTNIGTDHIRDHGNRRNYVATKQKMFRDLAAVAGRRDPIAILNTDDRTASSFRRCLPQHVTRISYGTTGPRGRHDGERPYLSARDIVSHSGGTRFTIDGLMEAPLLCDSRLYGTFNVSNVLAAVACATALGCDPRQTVKHVAGLVPPPGRFHIIAPASACQPGVVVDYAHTPESLESALRAARSLTPTGRVHIVFGCGGDCYKGKRPLMGAIAAREADRVAITSDNPRGEDPAAIARHVLAGVPRSHRSSVTVELDRGTAIENMIASAANGDVVLVAGKGNERTQEIGGRVLAFSDSRAASRALDARLGDRAVPACALTATAAVVLDVNERPVFTRHGEMPHPPASLAKLMTLYLAFEELAGGEVELRTLVTISRYAASTPHSRLPLRAGDKIRFGTLLQAVIIRSSNAAATAIAEHIAGAESTFVAQMNAAAATLGLTATRFATPHGLPHRHQLTTALDVARLLSHLCREHRVAIGMLRRSSFRFRDTRYVRPIALLRRRGLLALKTGFTSEAGYNLALASRERGGERYVVVLGAESRARSMADGQRLLELD